VKTRAQIRTSWTNTGNTPSGLGDKQERLANRSGNAKKQREDEAREGQKGQREGKEQKKKQGQYHIGFSVLSFFSVCIPYVLTISRTSRPTVQQRAIFVFWIALDCLGREGSGRGWWSWAGVFLPFFFFRFSLVEMIRTGLCRRHINLAYMHLFVFVVVGVVFFRRFGS